MRGFDPGSAAPIALRKYQSTISSTLKGMFNSGRLLSASLPIKRIRMHISQNFLLLAPVNERQMKNGADFSLFKQGTG